MRSFALFVPIDQEAVGDEVMTQIYGSPQSGSFIRALSADGNPPFTHLGAYAAGLDVDQVATLTSQSTVAYVESPWATALAEVGLLMQSA